MADADRLTSLRKELDYYRALRTEELRKGAARDKDLVQSYDNAAEELLEEIKSLQSNQAGGQPATVFCAVSEDKGALESLKALANKLQLSDWLDGPALLALTTPKLKLLLSRARPDLPPDAAANTMQQIKDAAGSLQLAYVEEQPRIVPGKAEVPKALVPVERVAEQAWLLKNMVMWEEIKMSKKSSRDTRANVMVCCNVSGTGKTTAADRAADPIQADLDELAILLPENRCRHEAFAKALACLRVTVHTSNLMRRGTFEGAETAEAAVAKVVWEALQKDVRAQLNLHLKATGTFLNGKHVLNAVREVLGEKLQILLHFDELQTVKDHGKEGGWFAAYAGKFNDVVSPKSKEEIAKLDTEAASARLAIVQEMAAVYGLWRLLDPVMRSPGHFVFLTVCGQRMMDPHAGRTMVPYLMGRNYIGMDETSPGDTCAHLLPPLTAAGILETAALTRCPNGESIVEALGFNQGDADELHSSEDALRCLHEAGARRRLPPTGSPVARLEAHCDNVHFSHKRKREDAGPATLEAAGQGSLRARSAGKGSEGLVSPAERAAADEPSLEPADFWLRTVPGDLGGGARRLLLLTLMVHWITCGVPLLVQLVLAEAVRMVDFYGWATRPVQELCEFFCDKDSKISLAITENEHSFKGINLSGLTVVEREQLQVPFITSTLHPVTITRHNEGCC